MTHSIVIILIIIANESLFIRILKLRGLPPSIYKIITIFKIYKGYKIHKTLATEFYKSS